MKGTYFSLCSHNYVIDLSIVKSMQLFTRHNPGYYTPHLTLERNLLYSEVFDSAEREYREFCEIFLKTNWLLVQQNAQHLLRSWAISNVLLSVAKCLKCWSLHVVHRLQKLSVTNQPLKIVMHWMKCLECFKM